MSTYAVFYYEGRDEQGEPEELEDIAYCDSYSCMVAMLDAAGVDMRGQHAGNGDSPEGVVQWGAYPAPDWPDYSVHCAHCKTLMHEGPDN